MPVHDLGYRSWSGERVGAFGRWTTIVTTGVRLAWKGRYLRRLMVFAWVPVLYVAGVLVAIEWVMVQQGPEAVAGLLPALSRDPADLARLGALALSEPGIFRGEVWTRLIHLYFRTPQPILMALIVGLVAPPLISRDLRSRAWTLYFSRPINRLDYLLGKCAVVAVFLIGITTAPALFVYLLGVALSPTTESMLSTWMLPFRIAGASLVLIVPTTVLSVCLSSLWYNSRTSTFAWYAIWVVGALVFTILAVVTGAMGERMAGTLPSEGPAEVGGARAGLVLFSFYHMLGAAQAWIFGIEPYNAVVTVALLGLTAITVGSTLLLFRRISALLRK